MFHGKHSRQQPFVLKPASSTLPDGVDIEQLKQSKKIQELKAQAAKLRAEAAELEVYYAEFTFEQAFIRHS